ATSRLCRGGEDEDENEEEEEEGGGVALGCTAVPPSQGRRFIRYLALTSVIWRYQALVVTVRPEARSVGAWER
ncbi:MAG TPA: hypothetical protein VJA21_11165, partial [Verrucomicrobiae bacterium]